MRCQLWRRFNGFDPGAIELFESDGIEISRRTVKDHTPFPEPDDAIPISHGQFHLVQAHEDEDPVLFAYVAKELKERLGPRRIQAGHGFICQDDPRILREGTCDSHALLLATA